MLDLNDTTDVGLAIASFGKDNKYNQPGTDQNSAIYMGHNKYGQVMVVDQWPSPPNDAARSTPNLHPMNNYGPDPGGAHRIENNSYYYHVIIAPAN